MAPKPDEPDVVVTYTAGAQQSAAGGWNAAGARTTEGVDVRGGTNGYDEPGQVVSREWDDAAADAETRRRYTEGNLVIDLLDGKSRRLVWRATATNAELASGRGARTIDSIIRQAFAGLGLGMQTPSPAVPGPSTTRSSTTKP